MTDEIRVRVIGPKDRPFYQLRAFRGRRCIKTKTTAIENTGRAREKRLADQEAGKWQAELNEGRYLEPSKITWEQFKDAYLDYMEAEGKAANTLRNIHSTFNLIRDTIAPSYLRDVNADAVGRFKKAISKGRADSTVATTMSATKAMLNWAVEEGLATEAPKIRVVRTDELKGAPVSPEEHAAILAHVEGTIPSPDVDAWRFFLRGLWHSGLRPSEALSLSWEPTDPVAVVMRPGEEPVLRFRPTGHKGRRAETTPVSPDFADMLLAVPEDQREGRVFSPNNGGGQIGEQRVRILFRAITVAAGVEHVELRGYRRAFGTRMAMEEETTVFELMKLMRHREIKTTLRYYIHLDAQAITGNLRRRRTTKRGGSDNEVGDILSENREIPGVSRI